MTLLPITLQCVRCDGFQGKPSGQPSWYLVLKDLIGHQLLQEVAMDSVARLCAAARGGPLKGQGTEVTPATAWTRRDAVRQQGDRDSKTRGARESCLQLSPGVQVHQQQDLHAGMEIGEG